jgi:hypothetical protein
MYIVLNNFKVKVLSSFDNIQEYIFYNIDTWDPIGIVFSYNCLLEGLMMAI